MQTMCLQSSTKECDCGKVLGALTARKLVCLKGRLRLAVMAVRRQRDAQSWGLPYTGGTSVQLSFELKSRILRQLQDLHGAARNCEKHECQGLDQPFC